MMAKMEMTVIGDSYDEDMSKLSDRVIAVLEAMLGDCGYLIVMTSDRVVDGKTIAVMNTNYSYDYAISMLNDAIANTELSKAQQAESHSQEHTDSSSPE